MELSYHNPSKIQNRHILLFVLAGTIVRYIYALYSKLWMFAPDQLAWGLSINEMVATSSVSYKQLIHYPHEGGSVLVSFIALALKPFDNFLPALSLAALTIDSVSRWIQLYIINKLFGVFATVSFGIWSVLSIPMLLSWSTVNFGLHSLISFCPFVFIYLCTLPMNANKRALLCGLFAGIAISIDYTNLLFVPVYFLFIVYTYIKERKVDEQVYLFLIAAAIALIPHFRLRYFFNSGFNLKPIAVDSIRDVDMSYVFNSDHYIYMINVWLSSIPSAISLLKDNDVSAFIIAPVTLIFIITGIVLFSFKNAMKKHSVFISVFLLFIFVAVYSISPFFADSLENFKNAPNGFYKNYIFYRHLSYILPLLFAIIFCGIGNLGKAKIIIATVFILFCGGLTINYFTVPYKYKTIDYKPAGWIIAKKYGEDTKKLMSIYNVCPKPLQNDLMFGYGWGLTATLLNGKTKKDKKDIALLVKLVNQFPDDNKMKLKEGVAYSFGADTKDIKDFDLKGILDSALNVNH